MPLKYLADDDDDDDDISHFDDDDHHDEDMHVFIACACHGCSAPS